MKRNHTKWQMAGRIFSVFLLTAMLAVVFTTPAYAGEFIEGDPDATVEEGEVIEDDLFIGGDDVLMAGEVEGDLFAAGETVTISGEVYGNAFVAGNTIIVSGEIEGALIIAGYDLVLEDGAYVGRNVYFGGFSLVAEPGSLIERSVYGGGYQLVLQGEVERDITAGLAALEISGPVGGDVYVDIGEPTDDSTYFFDYWMPGMPAIDMLEPGYDVDEDVVDGKVDIEIIPVETDVDVDIPDFRFDPAWYVLQTMRRRVGEFIALLLVGALALWLGKDLFLKAHKEVKANAGMDTLWGLLVYVLYIPVVMLLFTVLVLLTLMFSLLTFGSLTGQLISVSSLTFFGVTTLFSLVTGLLTKALVGYLVGRWLLSKMTQMTYEGFWQHFAALAVGVFLYEVLRAIPVFGFLLMLVVVVIGTGAFFVLVKNALEKKAPAGEVVEAVEAEAGSEE